MYFFKYMSMCVHFNIQLTLDTKNTYAKDWVLVRDTQIMYHGWKGEAGEGEN